MDISDMSIEELNEHIRISAEANNETYRLELEQKYCKSWVRTDDMNAIAKEIGRRASEGDTFAQDVQALYAWQMRVSAEHTKQAVTCALNIKNKSAKSWITDFVTTLQDFCTNNKGNL